MRKFPFVLVVCLAACQANTTRPPIAPMPLSLTAEVRMSIPAGTRLLTSALQADSIPLTRIEELDGYVESPWFAVAGREPAASRPVGPEVVRVRGWVDPARPGYVRFTVEIVYRPWLDPSRADRDLERPVSADHRVKEQIAARLKRLAVVYGDAVDSAGVGR